MTIFKSKGMQWCTFYYIGANEENAKGMIKKLRYYNPEKRIEKEGCEVLFDSEKILVLLTPEDVIAQFENN